MKAKLREAFEEVDSALKKIKRAMESCDEKRKRELGQRALILAWDRKEIYHKMLAYNRDWVRGLSLS
jgi:hypothetical protein